MLAYQSCGLNLISQSLSFGLAEQPHLHNQHLTEAFINLLVVWLEPMTFYHIKSINLSGFSLMINNYNLCWLINGTCTEECVSIPSADTYCTQLV